MLEVEEEKEEEEEEGQLRNIPQSAYYAESVLEMKQQTNRHDGRVCDGV